MAEIFISHRGADNIDAARLKEDLESLGHTVRLDIAEVNVGDSIPEWMNTALGAAQVVLLCYSSSGVDAPWMSREWLSALARTLEGENILLIPVNLTGGEVPPILADIKYADAVADWDAAVAEIDRAIRARF